jgi:hypothetical protein
MRDEAAVIDPSADCTGRDAKTFRDLGNREEFDSIVAVIAMTDFPISIRFQLRTRLRGGAATQGARGE